MAREARDGGDDVRFALDPLWCDPAIDAVAIDWYAPVSDWRDGSSMPTRRSTTGRTTSGCSRTGPPRARGSTGITRNAAERRGPAAAADHGRRREKPWVFRPKDLLSWWSNRHFERVGGVESASPRDGRRDRSRSGCWSSAARPWIAPATGRMSSRPEILCDRPAAGLARDAGRPDAGPAADGRARQARPGRRWLRRNANPLAPSYDGRMVDPARIYLWAWDARPFPAFPAHADRWADSANFRDGALAERPDRGRADGRSPRGDDYGCRVWRCGVRRAVADRRGWFRRGLCAGSAALAQGCDRAVGLRVRLRCAGDGGQAAFRPPPFESGRDARAGRFRRGAGGRSAGAGADAGQRAADGADAGFRRIRLGLPAGCGARPGSGRARRPGGRGRTRGGPAAGARHPSHGGDAERGQDRARQRVVRLAPSRLAFEPGDVLASRDGATG